LAVVSRSCIFLEEISRFLADSNGAFVSDLTLNAREMLFNTSGILSICGIYSCLVG
jgi:hypothetical protein